MMGLAEYFLSMLSLDVLATSFISLFWDHDLLRAVFWVLVAIVLALYAIIFRPDRRQS